jgi:hypothetical protein
VATPIVVTDWPPGVDRACGSAGHPTDDDNFVEIHEIDNVIF